MTAEIRAWTSANALARAAYDRSTKCRVCGDFLPLSADGKPNAITCPRCRPILRANQKREAARRRRAA